MEIIRGESLEYTPASHEDAERPGVLKRVLATRDHLWVGRVQMVNWARLPAGQSFRRHYHEDMQEVFVIVDGQIDVTAGEHRDRVSRGDAVLIDPREVHQMTNTESQDAYYVVFGISSGQGGKTVVCDD